MTLHKHDPGVYTVRLFTSAGRPRQRQWLAVSYQSATGLVTRWSRRTGGTGVVLRCLYNSALMRPTMPERWQG
jgi:hypothetical protein